MPSRLVNNALSGMGGWAKVWAPASSGRCRNALESTCLESVPPSPQYGTTLAFQLEVILTRERHNLCSGCTHRTIPVDGF